MKRMMILAMMLVLAGVFSLPAYARDFPKATDSRQAAGMQIPTKNLMVKPEAKRLGKAWAFMKGACKDGYQFSFPSISPSFGAEANDATFGCTMQSAYCGGDVSQWCQLNPNLCVKEDTEKCNPVLENKVLSYLCLRGYPVPPNPCLPGFKYVSVWGDKGVVSGWACVKDGEPSSADGFTNLGSICPANFESKYPNGVISCSLDKPPEGQSGYEKFADFKNCLFEGEFKWDDNSKTKECCQKFGGKIDSFLYDCKAKGITLFDGGKVPDDVCTGGSATTYMDLYDSGSGSACCFLPQE